MKVKLLIEGGYLTGRPDFGAVYLWDGKDYKHLGNCDYGVGLKECIRRLFRMRGMKVKIGRVFKINEFQREVDVMVE